jgi:hypothetical protein
LSMPPAYRNTNEVVLRTPVNKGKMKGRSNYAPA